MPSVQPGFGPLSKIKDEPWMSEPRLWVTGSGVTHAASCCGMVGRGIVSKLLCGGGSTFWPHGTTYYGARYGKPKLRFCRKCIAAIRVKSNAGK